MSCASGCVMRSLIACISREAFESGEYTGTRHPRQCPLGAGSPPELSPAVHEWGGRGRDVRACDVHRQEASHGVVVQRLGDQDRARPWGSTCRTATDPPRSGARPGGPARRRCSARSARSAAAAERVHQEEDEHAKPRSCDRRSWTAWPSSASAACASKSSTSSEDDDEGRNLGRSMGDESTCSTVAGRELSDTAMSKPPCTM